MRLLLLVFITLPILEIWVLLQVGGAIGALPTVALVVLTAVIGVALLRQQGFQTLLRGRTKLENGEVPASELAEAIFLAVGGALLLTPGFITDAIGFCCLLPGIRQAIIGWGLRQAASRRTPANTHTESHTIEGEYHREDEPRK